MKITEIELFHIVIPFARPYKLSKVYGTLTHAEAVILKMHTDEGLVGWGEADPMNPFTEETPSTVLAVMGDLIGPRLIGRDPRRIAEAEAVLDTAVHGHLMARGAVNMALFDILGKAFQAPAYIFLGGLRHPSLPLLGPIGSGTPQEDAEAIDGLIEAGYRTVMIKMGALPIEREIERMLAAKSRYGDRLSLIADANQGWSFKEAARFMEGIRGSEPDMIEQPVSRHGIEALAHLRKRLPCLLSADESLVTVEDAVALIQSQAVDAFSIKVSKNGGLSRSQTIAKAAEAFGIRCLMNSMLEFGITQAASLQLGCTLTHLVDFGHAYMSVLRMADDITDFRDRIRNAEVAVPDRPGLGVAVDEDRLKGYAKGHIRIKQ